MPTHDKDSLSGFTDSTALPQTAEQAAEWQQSNRAWWESHPMRYDWLEQLGVAEFSQGFYDEIDRRFFADSAEYLPPKRLPFDGLMPFDELPKLDVLEIGVGNGSHAGLLSRHAKSFTGIDLTEYAIKSTSERLRLAGIPARVQRMDAEHMEFPDASFDFIWTWGVIHHSSNTRKILEEMHRVLRPGGRTIVMIYYRNFWNYYIQGGLLHGILRGKLFQAGSLHKVNQIQTDGALARFYTMPEWRETVKDLFTVDKLEVFGPKSHVMPLPPGRVKNAALKLLPGGVSRFLNHSLRMGYFLTAHMTRK